MKAAIATVVILLVLAGYFLLSSQSSTPPASPNTSPSITAEQDSPTTSSNYIIYEGPETIANNQNEKRVLYFYASWCPICRPVDAELKQIPSKIPDNLTIIRVNYDDPGKTDKNEDALAEKYNVTYQHTFVQIDENENQINIWQGGGLEEILANII